MSYFVPFVPNYPELLVTRRQIDNQLIRHLLVSLYDYMTPFGFMSNETQYLMISVPIAHLDYENEYPSTTLPLRPFVVTALDSELRIASSVASLAAVNN